MGRKIEAETYIGNFGQTVSAFVIHADANAAALPHPDEFTLKGARADLSGKKMATKITAVVNTADGIRIETEPFTYQSDFSVECSNDEFSFAKKDITGVRTAWVDKFTAHKENDVLYRLYTPECAESRPLVLFLHGGGEIGCDNTAQMVNTMGAANWAERYPDIFVMAPQAPGTFNSAAVADSKAMIRNASRGFMANGSSKGGNFGWTREYLSKVCLIIRKMIADGRVCAERVYVTGMSAGGAGTLKALSADRTLFAAAAPICPSMNSETFGILRSLGDMKIWISTAYVDYAMCRHKYIVDGIMQLVREGNRNAFLTLYSPAELEKYGIGCNPELTTDEIVLENHNSWILTYNNEYGIMDWLIGQTKESR